jgi:hypothetical protein
MTGVDSKLYISFTLFNYIRVYNYLPSEKVKLTLIIQLKDSLRRMFGYYPVSNCEKMILIVLKTTNMVVQEEIPADLIVMKHYRK